MKKRNAILMLSALLSLVALSSCAESGTPAAKQTSAPPSEGVSMESPAPTAAPDYSDIAALFSSLRDGSEVSFVDKDTRLEVVVQCADLTPDTKPEGWDSIVSSFTAALVDGKTTAEQYGFKELSGQLESGDGSILISGFGGEVKFDLFSQAASGAASVTLGPGTYKVGQDINAGTYDCIAVSGFGVLRGDVAAFGAPGFLQTMGSVSASVGGDSVSIGGSSSYSNLTLADGDVIYIEMNLNVEFVPK